MRPSRLSGIFDGEIIIRKTLSLCASAILTLVILLVSSACSVKSTSPRSEPGRLPNTSVSPSTRPTQVFATATLPANTPTFPPALPSPTATLRAILTHPRLETVAENLTNPDDLLVGPDGSIYLSDVGDGTIHRIGADGQPQVILSGLNEPEGMLFLPDGSLVFIEQGLNRLDRRDAQTQKWHPWLTFENRTGRAGVDNIALDARPGNPASLIIPDSPNNRILRVSLDGKTTTEIASGLNRPTGAWVEPDGSLLVVEENGNKLDRISHGGQVEVVAKFSIPDDVVEDGAGNIFVCTLGDGAVYWLASQSTQPHLLVSGLSSPQGMALDLDGNLLVTDPGHHRLVKIVLHEKPQK